MKHKLFYLSIFIALIFISSSCTTRRSVYYTVYASDEGARHPSSVRVDAVMPSQLDAVVKDTISAFVDIDREPFELEMKSSIPIYVSMEQSTMRVNEITFGMASTEIYDEMIEVVPGESTRIYRPDFDVLDCVSPYYVDRFLVSEESDSLYNKHVYMDYKKGKQIKLPSVRYDKSSSPVVVEFDIVYYTDLERTHMRQMNFSVYQSDVVRYDKMREYGGAGGVYSSIWVEDRDMGRSLDWHVIGLIAASPILVPVFIIMLPYILIDKLYIHPY